MFKLFLLFWDLENKNFIIQLQWFLLKVLFFIMLKWGVIWISKYFVFCSKANNFYCFSSSGTFLLLYCIIVLQSVLNSCLLYQLCVQLCLFPPFMPGNLWLQKTILLTSTMLLGRKENLMHLFWTKPTMAHMMKQLVLTGLMIPSELLNWSTVCLHMLIFECTLQSHFLSSEVLYWL